MSVYIKEEVFQMLNRWFLYGRSFFNFGNIFRIALDGDQMFGSVILYFTDGNSHTLEDALPNYEAAEDLARRILIGEFDVETPIITTKEI